MPDAHGVTGVLPLVHCHLLGIMSSRSWFIGRISWHLVPGKHRVQRLLISGDVRMDGIMASWSWSLVKIIQIASYIGSSRHGVTSGGLLVDDLRSYQSWEIVAVGSRLLVTLSVSGTGSHGVNCGMALALGVTLLRAVGIWGRGDKGVGVLLSAEDGVFGCAVVTNSGVVGRDGVFGSWTAFTGKHCREEN